MWGRGPKGNNGTCWALGWFLVASSVIPQANWALLVLIPGWVGFCSSRTLWVSPMNSLVSLGVSSAAKDPTDFFQSEFLRLYFPALEPWVAQSVLLPRCSFWFILMQMWDHWLLQPPPHPVHELPPCHDSSLPWLPISAPPTSLDECFFFNALVVGLPYSSSFCQFWLFFVLKFFVVLHLVV